MKLISKSAIIGAAALTTILVGCGPSEPELDLSAVLDVTANTLDTYAASLGDGTDIDPDDALIGLANELGTSYSAADPALYTGPVAVAAQADASLLAVHDANNNQEADMDEDPLWMIEIDGENSRLIATSKNGAIGEHRFSGTGLLAGYLIGSMLTRQRAAGANPSSKQPRTAKQAARARAGSGSHSKGK